MTTLPHDPYADLTTTPEPHAPTNTSASSRRITPFSVVIVMAVVLLIGVVGWGIYQNELDTRNQGEAPDFTLRTYDGDNLKLSSLRGNKVVVINFWQSNCAPCHDEAPMLVRLAEEYADDGVIFIGINSKDPDKLALAYLEQYGITYPNGLDVGDKIQEAFRTTGYPETFIIDRDGNIQRHFAGPPSEIELRAEIERVLELG